MNTQTVSPEVIENTRKLSAKIHAQILQHVSLITQKKVAEIMGTSDATVSRMVSDHLCNFSLLMASCGLAAFPSNYVVISREELRLYKLAMWRNLESEFEDERMNAIKGNIHGR